MIENLNKQLDYIVKVLNASDNSIVNKDVINECKKNLDIPYSTSFGEYYNLILKNKKSNGVVYTPKKLTDILVKDIINKDYIISNAYTKILDPSCGVGNILMEVYRYLYEVFEDNLEEINKNNDLNLSKENIAKHIIVHNIFGYDIDEIALKVLSVDIYIATGIYYSKNLKIRDFLIDKNKELYDYIIGNPPYVGHKAIDKEYSYLLREHYSDIYKDKGDLSYCFIKKSYDYLREAGKVAFIVPRYILEGKSSSYIRSFMDRNYSIKKIIDFYGLRPFAYTGVDPMIIYMSKKKNKECKVKVIRPYFKDILNDKTEIEKFKCYDTKIIDSKGVWVLLDQKEKRLLNKIESKSDYKIEDFCKIFQGIITGLDKAFVVESSHIIKHNIEKELLCKWIKNSYIKKGKVQGDEKYLIYSDDIEKEVQYPNAIKYIERYKERLENRRECKNGIRKWYNLQWGRKKSLFKEKKIVFPYKSPNNKFSIDTGSFFSADVYGIKIKENITTYEYLESLLNTEIYEFYFKVFLKKLGKNMYEYYPNKINKFLVPIIKGKDRVSNKDLEIYFQLDEEDIKIIKEYCI